MEGNRPRPSRQERDQHRVEIGHGVFVDMFYKEIHEAMVIVRNPGDLPEPDLRAIKHDVVLILQLGKARFGLDPNMAIALSDQRWADEEKLKEDPPL